MSASALRTETYLWLAQRLSALILTICITVHIATMIIAVQGGLSSEEIIARIGGSKIWLCFYLVFVTSVAVHAPIGLKSIMREMTQIPMKRIDFLRILFSLIIGVLGIRAAFGLYGLGGA
jgi:fumarate reductase subunit C